MRQAECSAKAEVIARNGGEVTEYRRIRARVSGRVQGVGFRAATERCAQALGLTGWVRNCEDHSVECLAEGEQAAIEEFIKYLRSGPLLARVDSLEYEDEPFQGGMTTFAVRR